MSIAIIYSLAFSLFIQSPNLYMNQTPPGTTPEKFAPGFVSLDSEYEFGSVFNAAGTEFFYGVDLNGKNEIRYSKLNGKVWSKPMTILSDEQFGFNDPFLSPDENRLYFISNLPTDGSGMAKDIDIWYVERDKNGWSKPINAGPAINSSVDEYYVSFTTEGTMYFSSKDKYADAPRYAFDIYRSEMVDGEFQTPERLPKEINTERYEADVYIAPDESYMIFCAIRKEGLGNGDLYISFRNDDGSWTTSKNMGESVNTPGHELCPFVTADGKYFLFTSNKDIYWVDAGIIENFRD